MSAHTTATLVEVTEALAAALQPLQVTVDGLQIVPYFNPAPTPPSIDVYPADPFWNGLGFERGGGQVSYTIRARVTTADYVAGSQLLLGLLEPDTGVTGVLFDDDTLGGLVEQAFVAADGVTGFREYLVDPTSGGKLLGCEWKVEVIL